MMKYLLVLALVALATASIPTNFDARENWSNCEYQILSQGGCGSCWDFCAMESFADRLCITGEAPSGTIISPEPILECSRQGCNGGGPSTAWYYVIDNGDTTCTEQCFSGCAPYDSMDGKSPACHAGTCDSGSKWPITYYAGSYRGLYGSNISYFQDELQSNGPLQACFTVYSNFYDFFNKDPTGIYTQANGTVSGGHCVKLLGWGTEGGQDYWTLANSWNTGWGDQGYFKMARGTNLCGIENQISQGFTLKQALALGEPLGIHRDYDTSFIVGGWHDHADLSDPLFHDAAEAGVAMVAEKLKREFTFDAVVSAETQVVEGLNFKLLVKTLEGTTISMKLLRNLAFEYELVEYALEF